MIFRKFLFLFGFIQTERPNIILLVTDDFGMGDFQERVLNQAKNLIHGMEKNCYFLNSRFQITNDKSPVPTPNIDRIGREGVNFFDAHSTSSRCGPSRWMMLTGRFDINFFWCLTPMLRSL